MNPSFPAACTSEMTPLTKDSPTFSWAPTKTTVSLGSKGNCGFRGRGGAAEGTSIRVYTDTSDPQLVTTTSRTVFRAAFLEKVACQFLSIDKPLFRQSLAVKGRAALDRAACPFLCTFPLSIPKQPDCAGKAPIRRECRRNDAGYFLSCPAAALRVFSIRIARVTGPTPPGTGVRQAAFWTTWS